MNPKVKSIKTKKAIDLMAQSIKGIQAQFRADIGPVAYAEGVPANDNILLGGCVYLNYLAQQKLLDNGFNAKLVGGFATFGVNKNEYGVIEFGYTGNMEVLTPNGGSFDGVGFLGHAWVEIRNLDLVVDDTLAHMKAHMISDNLNRGIVDDDYQLSESKVVLQRSELTTRKRIVEGGIGYHYSSSAAQTERANARLEVLKSAVQES